MRNFSKKRMPTAARLAAAAGGAVGVAVLAAACSSAGSSTGSSTGSGAGASSGAAAGSGTSAGGSAMVIKTASSSAGTILIDGSGRAVYAWSKDTGDSSACSGACAAAWPPVTTMGAATASGGAQSSDLGTITRSDGTKQVTYDKHPLYFYAGDSGPGSAAGQASDQFGAKWWLVAPSGSDVTAAVSSFTVGGGGSAPTPAPSSSSAGGSWG
ncbi:MAG: COG4315 family predicted lipoprotein [Trebonia sp.]